MNQRSSAPARALAVVALIGGVLLIAIVVAASLGGGDGGGGSGGGGHAARHDSVGRHVPKTYVVQSGDTLTAISRHTGVSVVRIRELNPGLDPQILISGETLKLR